LANYGQPVALTGINAIGLQSGRIEQEAYRTLAVVEVGDQVQAIHDAAILWRST
jgi:hypothetical protein